MNQDLLEFIKTYGTKSQADVQDLLNNKSRSNLTSMLIDLTTQYFNDKNSSTLREFLVVSLSGFNHISKKIGYNGYRHAGIGDKKEFCEVKPVNITSENTKKLNGYGNFTDYSWKKFKRHKKENPIMLVAGFIDGKLIYILSFKFNCKGFQNRIEEQLKRQYPDGDESGKYLRSASFSLRHYKEAKDLSVRVFVTEENLNDHSSKITADMQNLLKKYMN